MYPTCRKYFPVLSSVIPYLRVCNLSNTTRVSHLSNTTRVSHLDCPPYFNVSPAKAVDRFSTKDNGYAGVESYYKTIVDAMMKTDNEALPRKQFVKHLKSYWNKVVDSMRSKRFVWIKNGKVHDKNNCDYIEYKRSKRIFRNKLELRIMNICVVFPINWRSLSILIRNIYGLY